MSDDVFNRGSVRPLVFMPNTVIDILENDHTKFTPKTALISIKDKELRHAIHPYKSVRGAAISNDDIEELIGHARKPSAILYDKQKKNILYIFETLSGLAKLAIDINTNDNGKVRNPVRTAGLIKLSNLKTDRYETLEGKL